MHPCAVQELTFDSDMSIMHWRLMYNTVKLIQQLNVGIREPAVPDPTQLQAAHRLRHQVLR